MNQNEINRVAGAGSIWGDLSLRLVIARLAGTTHPHFTGFAELSITGTPSSTGLQGDSAAVPLKNKGHAISCIFPPCVLQDFQTPCLSRLSVSVGVSSVTVHGGSRLRISEMDSAGIVANWSKLAPPGSPLNFSLVG